MGRKCTGRPTRLGLCLMDRLGKRLAGRLGLGLLFAARGLVDRLVELGPWQQRPTSSLPLLSSPACFLLRQTVLRHGDAHQWQLGSRSKWISSRSGLSPPVVASALAPPHLLCSLPFPLVPFLCSWRRGGVNKLSVARSWCGEVGLGRRC